LNSNLVSSVLMGKKMQEKLSCIKRGKGGKEPGTLFKGVTIRGIMREKRNQTERIRRKNCVRKSGTGEWEQTVTAESTSF